MFTSVTLAAVLAVGAACDRRPMPAGKPAANNKEQSVTSSKQIRFYEDDKLITTDDFAHVPDNIRYVEVDGVKIEVSKVVAHTAGNQRAIEQYSADGVMLRRTLQIRDSQ
jgi:hypothetical protein